jgi:protein-disulfide isomerase
LKAEDYVGYMNGVFNELGLGAIMQQRGISVAQSKACLADKKGFEQVMAMADVGNAMGVHGTPTFLINGKIDEDVHSFAALQAKLPQ